MVLGKIRQTGLRTVRCCLEVCWLTFEGWNLTPVVFYLQHSPVRRCMPMLQTCMYDSFHKKKTGLCTGNRSIHSMSSIVSWVRLEVGSYRELPRSHPPSRVL